MKTFLVTDHALLRYMERKHGFCIAHAKAHIAEICSPAALAGSTSFTDADGLKFCFKKSKFKDGEIILATVLGEGMKQGKNGKHTLDADEKKSNSNTDWGQADHSQAAKRRRIAGVKVLR